VEPRNRLLTVFITTSVTVTNAACMWYPQLIKTVRQLVTQDVLKELLFNIGFMDKVLLISATPACMWLPQVIKMVRQCCHTSWQGTLQVLLFNYVHRTVHKYSAFLHVFSVLYHKGVAILDKALAGFSQKHQLRARYIVQSTT
jgi:hypothetical protein